MIDQREHHKNYWFFRAGLAGRMLYASMVISLLFSIRSTAESLCSQHTTLHLSIVYCSVLTKNDQIQVCPVQFMLPFLSI